MSELTDQIIKRPRTLEECAQVVHAASEARVHVKIAGSGSLTTERFDDDGRAVWTLSTARMNTVIEHAVSDMTVIVHAGMSLEALQRQLAWQGQWLPIDPPVVGRDGRVPGHRTIGGLIASNALGPLRFGCGDWRLWIMGMRWIDAEGRIIRGGGRTVKNVAGYSTPRLMIGSGGSLGVIGEVTLRTFARPEDEKCVVFFCENAPVAEALLGAVMVSPTTPAYVQVIGGGTFAQNPLQLPVPTGRGEGRKGMVVVVGFLGRPEICEAQVETVRGLAAAKKLESISQTAAQAGRLRLWMTTEPALLGNAEEAGVGFRIHGQSSEVTGIVEALQKESSDAWVVSEASSGVTRGMLPGKEAAARVIGIVRKAGATAVWTQGPQRSPPAHALARRLKAELDPHGTFVAASAAL